MRVTLLLLLPLFYAHEVFGFTNQNRIRRIFSASAGGAAQSQPRPPPARCRRRGRAVQASTDNDGLPRTPRWQKQANRRTFVLSGVLDSDDSTDPIASASSSPPPINWVTESWSDPELDMTPLAFGSSPEQQLLPASSSSSASLIELPLPLLALAGSVTTLFTDMLMHPIDCIKILQQSDAGFGMSMKDAAIALWERDGLSGFYSGFLTYACSDAAGGALKFAVWELWKRRMPSQLSAPPNDVSAHHFSSSRYLQWGYLFVGAALAFVASSVAIVPGEFIKNQLQMDRYDGLQEAVVGIMSAHGLAGFFVGYEGVMYRDVPYTMLELGLYEVFKTVLFNPQWFKERQGDDGRSDGGTAWDDVVAAAMTGGITAFLTTPLDVIKTKLMVDDEYAGYSFLECWLATIDAHGIGSVFAGIVARVAWILPFTTIYLPTYDFLKRLLWQRYLQTTNVQSEV